MKGNLLVGTALFRVLFLTAVCGAFAFFAAYAQPGSAGKPLAPQDQRFLLSLAQHSRGEVQISRMVAARTSNPQVKEFAERVAHDDQALDRQMAQVMSRHGMAMPAPLTDEQRLRLSRLESVSGSELDRVYLEDQVKEGQNEVQKVSHYAQGGEQQAPDPSVVALAQESLPVLKQHLDQSSKMAAQLGARPDVNHR